MIHALAPALKHRDYRIYFCGQAISLAGTWMQQIALGWMTYKIGGSPWALAFIALATQAPILLIGPWAGALADKMPRRSILLTTQSAFLLQAIALAFLAFSGKGELWHLQVLAIGMGIINAFDNPVRQAFACGLVEKENLPNAIALNSLLVNVARIIGPALAAATLSVTGEGACFSINAMSYVAAIFALWLLKPPIPVISESRGKKVMTLLKEGWQEAMRNAHIKMVLTVVCLTSFFGSPYSTFLPMVAKDHFNGGAGLYGLMTAWGATGALIGAFGLSIRKKTSLTKILTICVPLGGLSLMGFSTARTPVEACFWLFFVSFGLLVSAVAANTLVQSEVRDEFRGRVMSLFSMAIFGIPPLGGLFISAIADHFGAQRAIGCAGFGVVLTGLWMISKEMKAKKMAIHEMESMLVEDLRDESHSKALGLEDPKP